MPRSPEVNELIRRLGASSESCETACVDLTEYRFRSDDSAMWLEHAKGLAGKERMFFRIDQTKPKDPDVNLGILQFCKVLKIPGTFFRENRPGMRETFVKNWISALVPGDPKSIMQVRARRGADFLSIRALLPTDSIDLSHHRVLSALFNDSDLSVDLLWSDGDTQDCRELEARFLVGPEFAVRGEMFRMGLHVGASELGCSDLWVEAFIHHVKEDWSALLSFTYERLFTQKYRGTQPKDVEVVLRGLVDDVLALTSVVQAGADALVEADFPGIDSCMGIVTRGMAKDLVSAIRREEECSSTTVDEHGEDVTLQGCDHPMWGYMGFVRGMARVARSFPPGKKRMLVERAAGILLQLNLEKK